MNKTYFQFLWKDIQIVYWKWRNVRLESKIAMIKIKAINKEIELTNKKIKKFYG